jgi:hypothetical protein
MPSSRAATTAGSDALKAHRARLVSERDAFPHGRRRQRLQPPAALDQQTGAGRVEVALELEAGAQLAARPSSTRRCTQSSPENGAAAPFRAAINGLQPRSSSGFEAALVLTPAVGARSPPILRAMYVNNRASNAVSRPAPVENTAPLRHAEGDRARSSAAEATNTHLSGPAQLMSKLSQLRDSAPAQFSQVVSGLAADLRDVAAHDTGMSAKMLTALASRLDGLAGSGESMRPTSSIAASAYRSNPDAELAGSDAARAALERMMDDLDAALKASASPQR